MLCVQPSLENPMQPDHVLMNLVHLSDSPDIRVGRERELLEDVAFVLLGSDHQLFPAESGVSVPLSRPQLDKLLLALNSPVEDRVDLTNGSTYEIKDFLTALVTLSRTLTSTQLDAEEKRRVLFSFGADQISP
jgi:hypothetical protein